MSHIVTILIASTAPADRARLVEWLTVPGFQPAAVGSFAEAKRLLDGDGPDLLVTDLKLGEYNGLHLVVRGHLHNPRMRVIVIGDPDPVLERDAQREGAAYLTLPYDRSQLLRCVARVLARRLELRRSGRKRITPVDAFIDTVPAAIVDVGYSGLRLACNADRTPPEHFIVHIPALDARVPSRRVWTSPALDSADTVWCGAEVDGTALDEWRAIVDRTEESDVAENEPDDSRSADPPD